MPGLSGMQPCAGRWCSARVGDGASPRPDSVSGTCSTARALVPVCDSAADTCCAPDTLSVSMVVECGFSPAAHGPLNGMMRLPHKLDPAQSSSGMPMAACVQMHGVHNPKQRV